VQGIGQVTSKLFASSGCKKLFLADLNTEALEQTKALIQEEVPDTEVSLWKVDISDESAVSRMIAKCVETYGRIDFACNNAGIGTTNSKTADTTTAAFDKICNVNEKGVST
jgi:NAD(P)-dependent dehydrogenase (short-subunit alcohol dehydrogenase family)